MSTNKKPPRANSPWGAIKVIERIVIWVGTPILAIYFFSYAGWILLAGAFLIWYTYPTKEETTIVSSAVNDGSRHNVEKHEKVRATARREPEPEQNQGYESDEDFLARQRFAEYSDTH